MKISSGVVLTKSTAKEKIDTVFKWLVEHHILAAFFLLLVIEICVFGSIVRHMGIYLDEWSSFCNLHFCRQELGDLTKCLLFDPRYIIRPAAAPYLATVYYFCHERPLTYHLLNQTWELTGAFFFYLALLGIFRDKVLSFFAAALFLIYPSHDITHYSIGAVSTSMAVTFYTISLWLFVQAVNTQRQIKHSVDKTYGLLLLSALFFLVSLLSYEICLPLFIVFTAVAAILLWKDTSPVNALSIAAFYTLPALIAVGLTVLYRIVLLPWLGMGCGYKIVFDMASFLQVIYEGIRVSISPYAFSFFLNLAQTYLSNGLNFVHWVALVIATVAMDNSCLAFCPYGTAIMPS